MDRAPHILVVEDDADTVGLIRAQLEPHFPGLHLTSASDGVAGLVAARERKPDVLLLDARLPLRDGWSVCAELKADPETRPIPVLMMSGTHRSAPERARGLELGADAYLCKPFEADELVAHVRTLLRIRANEDLLRRHQARLQEDLERMTASQRASETRFRVLFEHSPDAMFVEDESGHVLDANEAAARLHGVTRAELIGKHVTDLVPPGHRDVVKRDYPKWFAGQLKIYEGYSYTADGRITPVEIKASRLEYDGRPALLLTVRDVTDRSPLEDRQSATTQGLRAIVEIADDLIACPDVDSLYRRAVELAREQLGLERAAIFLSDGHRVRATFGTDMRGQVTDERSHIIPMDDQWRERFRLRTQHEPRWSLSLEPLQDWENGQMKPRGQGWVAVTPIQTASKAMGVFCNDSAITKLPFDPVKQEIVAVYCSLLANIIERKTAESERSLLASALEQSAEAVVITDLHGTITYVNPAFERITGYARAEALGRNPRMLKSGRMDAGYYTAMWTTLSRGEVWTGHVTNRRKDGRLYEAEQVISPIKSGTGDTTGYLAVSQDITRAVEMENALRQSQKMESIGRLAGGIAHDFNNQLTGILGFARLIKDSLDADHACQADVDEIIKSGERAAVLTRQLLAFGHKQVIQVQPLNLNSVVGQIDQLLRRTLGEHIELVTHMAPDLPSVEADAGMLEQVVMNLAVNAREAMPQGGKLVLGTSVALVDAAALATRKDLAPGRYVCLSVRDTGSGMTEQVRQQAFEPFFTTKERGQGLGLSMVYGIVKRCRGFIELDSAPGAGAEFRIFLPSVDARPLEESPKAAAPLRGGAERILVVEDEPAVRNLTMRGLAQLGYRVMEAAHGGEGLRLFQREGGAFDLIVTDVVMPMMGGPELIAKVREQKPAIRVLYMSGFTQDLKLDGVHVNNAASLILKPFSLETLAAEVRRILDAR
jgi:PAS domain S-box-containing protein